MDDVDTLPVKHFLKQILAGRGNDLSFLEQ